MNRHTTTIAAQPQIQSSSLGEFLKRVGHLQRLLGETTSPDYFQERSLIAQLQRVSSRRQEDMRTREESGLRKGMMDTFSRTERTVLSEEDSEYLNYLKQYETVIKNSRRKEYISPSRQKQEMHDLISEFLSDLPNTQPSPSSRLDKPPVKIEKIDLTYLQPRTPKTNQTEKQFTINIVGRDGSRSPVRSIKDEPSPRFANPSDKVQEKKANGKKKQSSATPVKIELLKVNNVKPKEKESGHAEILHYGEQGLDRNQQGDYRDSYLKKRQAKVEKQEPPKPVIAAPKYSAVVAPPQPKQQKTYKKPIKIQIQIPVQDLEEHSIESSMQLDNEQREIIKQISQKVKTLLHKNNAG